MFSVFTLLNSCAVAMSFSTQALTLWEFQLAQSRAVCALRNTCCCEHIKSAPLTKVASQQAAYDVLVLPYGRSLTRSLTTPSPSV